MNPVPSKVLEMLRYLSWFMAGVVAMVPLYSCGGHCMPRIFRNGFITEIQAQAARQPASLEGKPLRSGEISPPDHSHLPSVQQPGDLRTALVLDIQCFVLVLSRKERRIAPLDLHPRLLQLLPRALQDTFFSSRVFCSF